MATKKAVKELELAKAKLGPKPDIYRIEGD
jgi:hypothetical protein